MCYTGINRLGRSFVLLMLISSGLSGCVSVSQNWNPQDYTVKSGDTLYSIAWRYEKDYQDIARWNNISAPYAIYPGQRLNMAPDDADGTIDHGESPPMMIELEPEAVPESDAAAVVIAMPSATQAAPQEPAARPDAIVVAQGDTLYSLARDNGVKVNQIARWNFLKPPYRIRVGQKLRLHPPMVGSNPVVTIDKGAGSPRQQAPSAPPAVVSTPVLPARVGSWMWPVKGKLVKTFDSRDTDRKGIGIRGKRGDEVKAAADGQVVYSGNGLISYGNLVIIKHSNAFLSAYAYNRSLLVKEGESVKAGQTIARMGTVDRGKAMLHFEIRKNGKPVNPLKYLPRTRG